MSTLWRSILQGAGWELGKQAAKDALKKAEDELLGPEEPPKPEEPPEARAKRLERELRAAEKAAGEAKKAREKAQKRLERDVEDELAALKKDVAKGKR